MGGDLKGIKPVAIEYCYKNCSPHPPFIVPSTITLSVMVEGTLSFNFIISVSPENVTIKESLKEECLYRLVKLPKLATRRQPRSTLEVPKGSE